MVLKKHLLPKTHRGECLTVPDASWGSLAAEGAATMDLFPWLIIFPGMALAVTLFSLNFLGDGLRDAFDPSLRSEAP